MSKHADIVNEQYNHRESNFVSLQTRITEAFKLAPKFEAQLEAELAAQEMMAEIQEEMARAEALAAFQQKLEDERAAAAKSTAAYQSKLAREAEIAARMKQLEIEREIAIFEAKLEAELASQALMAGGFVYLINSDNTISKTEIEVGLSNWQHTEVLSGLTIENEIVLSVDRLGLEDGATIIVEETDKSDEEETDTSINVELD